MQSYIGATEQNVGLYEEKNFNARADVIDFIGFQVTEQIEELLQENGQTNALLLLKHRAEKIEHGLGEIDTILFQKLQAGIRTAVHTGTAFKQLVNEYFDFDSCHKQPQEEPAYDNLDAFINHLFSFQPPPSQTKELEPEMVRYQKTPARIVFELAEKSYFKDDDVFFDIGSGLGQVAILVYLLTGVAARGVDFEPAFCRYAVECTNALNLSNVEFINVDARQADFSKGTIFFMYTPFKGTMLQEVLEALRKESLQRKITLVTFGPCTAEVAKQSWLDSAEPKDDDSYKLAYFVSH